MTDENTTSMALAEKPLTFQPLGEDTTIELTINMVGRYLANPTRRGFKPDRGDVVKFMKLCQARKLNPWTGDAYLLGYDTDNGPKFDLITSYQALLKRAEFNDSFDGMTAGVLIKSGDSLIEREGTVVLTSEVLVGGWSRVKRSDRKVDTFCTVQLATYTTGKSRWRKDPAGMIRKCAAAAALREAFPNTTAGLYVEGEMAESREPEESKPVEASTVVTSEAVADKPANAPPVPAAETVNVKAEDLFSEYDAAPAAEVKKPAEPKAASRPKKEKAKTPPQTSKEPAPSKPEPAPAQIDEDPFADDNAAIEDAEFEVQNPEPETATATAPVKQAVLPETDTPGGFEPEELVHDARSLQSCKSAAAVSKWKTMELELGSDPAAVKTLADQMLEELG